jgi:hypothetical protein
MTQCPKAEIIHPCVCTDSTQDNSSTIICKDTEFIDLRSLLAKASKSVQKKNFTQFILENNPMDKIVSHVFSDLHFTKVHFINCTNLTVIDQDAFGGISYFFIFFLILNIYFFKLLIKTSFFVKLLTHLFIFSLLHNKVVSKQVICKEFTKIAQK